MGKTWEASSDTGTKKVLDCRLCSTLDQASKWNEACYVCLHGLVLVLLGVKSKHLWNWDYGC